MVRMWQTALKGLFIMDPFGMGFYKLSGSPLWMTVLLTTIKALVWMLVIFYGAGWIIRIGGWIVRQLKRWEFLRPIFIKLSQYKNKTRKKIRENSYSVRRRNIENKLLLWLIKGKGWVVVLVIFIPFVPVLPLVAIAAVRIMRIKYALPLLFLSTIFKSIIFCWSIYGFTLQW